MLGQNMQALPGTVLEDQPGALQTGQTILPILKDDAAKKAAEQKKAADDKEKAAKEVLGREIKQVAPWDTDEYAALTTAYRDFVSEAFRVSDANPNDRSLDPREPGSKVRLEIDKKWDAIQQYQNSSKANLDGWVEYTKTFDPAKDSPLDFEERRKYYQSNASKHMTGEVGGFREYGVLDLGTHFLETANKIQKDKDASAYPSGQAYLRTSSNEYVPESRIWETAESMAQPSLSNKPYNHIVQAIDALKDKNPAEFERISTLAEKNGKTIETQYAYENLTGKLGTQKTADIKGDPTYGAGGINREALGAEWIVGQYDAVEKGDGTAFNWSKLTDAEGNDITDLPKGGYNDMAVVAKQRDAIIGKMRTQLRVPAKVTDEQLFEIWDAAGRPAEIGVYSDQRELNTRKDKIRIEGVPQPIEIAQKQTMLVRFKDAEGNDKVMSVNDWAYDDVASSAGATAEQVAAGAAAKGLKQEIVILNPEEYTNWSIGTMVQSGANEEIDPAAVYKRIKERGGSVETPLATAGGGPQKKTTVTYPETPAQKAAREKAEKEAAGKAAQQQKPAEQKPKQEQVPTTTNGLYGN